MKIIIGFILAYIGILGLVFLSMIITAKTRRRYTDKRTEQERFYRAKYQEYQKAPKEVREAMSHAAWYPAMMSYANDYQRREQERLFQEQNRLFQEQMLRDQQVHQQHQAMHQQFVEQTTQQQIDNMNNFPPDFPTF